MILMMGIIVFYPDSNLKGQSIFIPNEPHVIGDDRYNLGHSIWIHAADLDNDGDKDVISLSGINDEWVWFRNNGNLDFDYPISIPSSTLGFTRITTSDLDNDGDLDVLASSIYDGQVSWFENDGTSNFATAQSIHSGGNTTDVIASDMDNDGLPDVLFSTYDGSIFWYRNLGAGSFGPQQTIVNTLGTILKLEVSDMDDDGDDDLLFAASENNMIAWFQNDGNGNFGTYILISDEVEHPQMVHASDLDGDGDMDVLSASEQDNKLAWYENDGTGIFGLQQIVSSDATGTRSVYTSDLDGDGDMDIISPQGMRSMRWYENNGNESFTPLDLEDFPTLNPSQVITADLNGDGTEEVLGASQTISGLGWMENLGDGLWGQYGECSQSIDNQVGFIDTTDLDGDGDLDVLAYTGFDRRLAWYENNGTGDYGKQQIINLGDTSYDHKLTGDIDDDGDMDVISLGILNNAEQLVVLENDGQQIFSIRPASNFLVPNITFHTAQLGDMDNDGDWDILASFNNELFWYENDGNGYYINELPITNTQGLIYQSHVLDMDQDDDNDIVLVANLGTSGNTVWLANDGSGNFGNPIALDINATITLPLSFVDFDHDGDSDIMSSNSSNMLLSWNDGQGNFTDPDWIPYVGTPTGHAADVEPADVDGDGDWDVIIQALYPYDGYGFYWMENQGQGNFGMPHLLRETSYAGYGGSIYYKGILAADLDHDGDDDVLLGGIDLAWHEASPDRGDLYVDASAPHTDYNRGYNWEYPFSNPQDALATAVPGTTIHIAKGTYCPTSQNGPRGAYFDLSNGITILGGYPSGGGLRDAATHHTVLSGDIDPDGTDGDSFHVIASKDVTDVHMDGLRIQSGNANATGSYGNARGGGAFIRESEIHFNNVIWEDNNAINGGALYARASEITIHQSTMNQNMADFGAAIYVENGISLEMEQSRVWNNNSLIRCAIELENNHHTLIANSLIANNESANANAISLLTTSAAASMEILNSTIIGASENKNLIRLEVTDGQVQDVVLHNSIIAHQNSDFDKNIIAYDDGNATLNLLHQYCYFQGESTIGTGNNNLFSSQSEELLLQSDYSLDSCSVAVDMGNDALVYGTLDINDHPRIFNTVDIGAHEVQTVCQTSVHLEDIPMEAWRIYPNPAHDVLRVETMSDNPSFIISDMLGRVYQHTNDSYIDISHLPKGIYLIQMMEEFRLVGTYRFVKQ